MNFGKDLLPLFQIKEGFVNFNHGSFGAVPKEVFQVHLENLKQCEEKPDVWFREAYREKIQLSRKLISEYVNANLDEVVLVESASYAVNSVFRSFPFQKGDTVVIFNRAYPMVKAVLKYLQKLHGIEIVEVPIQFPIKSEDDLIGPFEKVIQERKSSVKLVSISHIESVPGIILPVKKIAKICKDLGIHVFVDGAHAIGQVPIDLKDLNVDYYVSNLHKWMYCPKGTAFLYIKKEHQNQVIPAVLNQYQFTVTPKLGFIDNFEFTGTKDYTPFCSIPAGFEFRSKLGDQKIISYIKDLAWEGTSYCAQLWGTSMLAPKEMYAFMCDVELPVKTYEEAEKLRVSILEKYNTYFIFYELQGKFYTRLSAQIYLQKSDFIELAQRIKQEITP